MMDTWQDTFKHRRYAYEGLLTLVVLLVSLYLCREVIHYAHTRPGVLLDDPILNLIGPVSVRWPVFLVLWSSLLTAFWSLLKTPRRLLMYLQAMAVLLLLRAAALYLVPLEPLPDIIPLADPLATLRSDSGALIVNDLFFSGHTASLFLLFLVVEGRKLRAFLLAATIFVGFGVLLHHAHYSGDVFAAPFFACGSWMLVRRVHQYFGDAESATQTS